MTDDIRPPRPDDAVREVARAMIDRGLGEGRSLFDPARPAWSRETVADLHRRYNQNLAVAGGDFLDRLRVQLAGAPDETVLLAAELLTLQALPLVNLTRAAKHERITRVLGWMAAPVELPEAVAAAFAQRTWSGGIGAHTNLWRWLVSAVELVQGFLDEPEEIRRRALVDPWAWRDLVHRLTSYPSLREALKYLAFPGTFLPIINPAQKRQIRDAFADRFGAATGDLDRDLRTVTLGLQAELGGPVEYYQPPLAPVWQRKPVVEGRRAWLVRPRAGGSALVERWLADGFVSVEAEYLVDAQPGAGLATVQAAVEAGYPHVTSGSERNALAAQFHAFLSTMEADHIIATLRDDVLLLGVVTGDATLDPDAEGEQLRREVRWAPTVREVVDDLPATVRSLLEQQGTVVDLTSSVGTLAALLNRGAGAQAPSGMPAPPDPAGPLPLRSVTSELAAGLHLDAGWLQEFVDLLAERRQAILFGPPGTGKTYLAQAIARHITQRDAIRLVQFHPSYSYEDFFEGFRPRESLDGSAPGFVKASGPLRELADQARKIPDLPHVLIIDEINRTNIAKVFGELYFLLEYRDASVRLQYSPAEPFSLPPNVLVIGTMNTADRSIAVVDAAIRRRFAFVELHPDEEPVRNLLPRWLAGRGESGERAALLRSLNDAIDADDRDFKLGPSYLMRPDLDQPGRLERVWRHDILPTLEEHYFGRLDREQVHGRFGLAAIRSRLHATAPPEPA